MSEAPEVLDLRLAPLDAKPNSPVAYARIRVGCVECSDLPVWRDQKLGLRIGAKRETWTNKVTQKEESRDIVRFSLSGQVALSTDLVRLLEGARPSKGAPIGGPRDDGHGAEGFGDVPF